MASDLDPAIANLSQELERYLKEGIQSFREGEGRGNSERIDDGVVSRHELLVMAGYCREGDKTGIIIDPGYPQPPSLYDDQVAVTSQLLHDVAVGRLELHDGKRYVQSGDDSYTQQLWKYYTKAIRVLRGECGALPSQEGDIFSPAVETSDRLSVTPGLDGLRSGRGVR
jgi:hypothetical protein